ncbi:secreted RxLR effector peptide protein, putative [Phytophthora infestans T30-4]|uniref:RxLR effector protein n=2 Tax=Phytophthora infestans TaxID=4787 RepID=D0NCS7_PHYIT|nr:secreted RxLR effector peptide protein, putative [Phytophthora infestans T30-4]EEY55791.1 secreted RxLR effector peptide protein, putative [Phytophthora infestans T30-4]KAF4042024.1 RXLR domain-containing protein [Phytophthora infestans]KAF4139661.1 RXLR effector domain-containing protein [Phytophthora infestans]KAI9984564.1 hypothetical protein PInf_005924 [Phytophthora infestans]|eukprot:XP_002903367.1 secreted RxLR effector peptide protein, putative [Phytophthora infestans T30-4]
MRLAHVFAVIAAACLVSSEAFATSDKKAKTSKATLLDAPGQRLLRAHRAADEDEIDSEERGLTKEHYELLAKYAKELKIDVAKAGKSTAYLNDPEVRENYAKYRAYLDFFIQGNRKKGERMVTYEHHG